MWKSIQVSLSSDNYHHRRWRRRRRNICLLLLLHWRGSWWANVSNWRRCYGQRWSSLPVSRGSKVFRWRGRWWRYPMSSFVSILILVEKRKCQKVKINLVQRWTNLISCWHWRRRRLDLRFLANNFFNIIRLYKIVNKVTSPPIFELILRHSSFRQERSKCFIFSR